MPSAARCLRPDRRSPGAACRAGRHADPGMPAGKFATGCHRLPARVTRGTARQAGEPGWRAPAAGHALRRQPPDRDPEDRREPHQLIHGEAALPIAAVSLDRAHGRRRRPAHQLTQRLLRPPPAQPQRTDIRPDDNPPVTGHLPDEPAPDPAHPATRFMLRGRHSRPSAGTPTSPARPLMTSPPPRTRQHREPDPGRAPAGRPLQQPLPRQAHRRPRSAAGPRGTRRFLIAREPAQRGTECQCPPEQSAHDTGDQARRAVFPCRAAAS
jgi:hypothetical protein